MTHTDGVSPDRRQEWFVPKFGPVKFRIFVGLLFPPYTGMVLSFAAIGAVTAREIHWDRVLAIAAIYFFGLGIAAHALDALGGKTQKPWGAVFSRPKLWKMAGASLVIAYGIALYYMIRFVPWLWVLAVLEGFFVFAYNLEWFGGRFHNDAWFAVSWGAMPVLAGHMMQANGVSLSAAALSAAAACFSLVEIKSSRPYKELRRNIEALDENQMVMMKRYEILLKSISLGVMALGLGLIFHRLQS